MTAKEIKAEYDRQYRLKNKERLRAKKQAYCESEAGRLMQKKQREKRKEYHNEYCRKPEQRALEKVNRHKREGIFGKTKFCIVCEKTKPVLEFSGFLVYPDKRCHSCKECEAKHKKELGVTARSAIQAIVTLSDYKLTRRDIAKHPYLIESKKYLIYLNKTLKL